MKFVKKILALALVVILAGAGFLVYLNDWWQTPLENQNTVLYKLKKGSSLRTVSQELQELGLIDKGLYFYLYARATGKFKGFQSGLYKIDGSNTPQELAQRFNSGEIYTPIAAEVSIPECFTTKKTFARLVATGIGSNEEFEALAKNQIFLRQLGIKGPYLEGFIFPAKYTFYNDKPSAKEAIVKFVETFFSNLPADYETQVKKLGLTLYEAVKFASLIEAETLLDEERPKVSEVIWNRLKSGSPLGIDASLIYGIEDYQGDIKWSHLRDKKNPYNSRIHKGLPPTPICSPGTASLKAVLTPTNYKYFYYVLIPGTKRHHFSKSLSEHQKHVKKLVDATIENR